MNIDLQKGANQDEIDWQSWQVGLCGVALDKRGKAAVQQIAGKADKLITLS